MDNKLKTVDAETLLSTPMSKTMFIVDGLISQGVNVISGASKIGKSWLMLWLGLQVAQGNSVWGLPTLQCDVLYLSLEDTQRRQHDGGNDGEIAGIAHQGVADGRGGEHHAQHQHQNPAGGAHEVDDGIGLGAQRL